MSPSHGLGTNHILDGLCAHLLQTQQLLGLPAAGPLGRGTAALDVMIAACIFAADVAALEAAIRAAASQGMAALGVSRLMYLLFYSDSCGKLHGQYFIPDPGPCPLL